MNIIVPKEFTSFNDLEKFIYGFVCIIGQEMTRYILERNDTELFSLRDPKTYRYKDMRNTSIKTLYGTVEYTRRRYNHIQENGSGKSCYLLDEMIKIDKIGLVSSNLAERIAHSITEETYRATADSISTLSGQHISPQGVWNLVQKLGERISREEEEDVLRLEAGELSGEEVAKVIFEEMDGVWLNMQGKKHKKMPKQEMKVSTTYEGWEKQGHKSYTLVNKRMFAGMERSEEFHKKREAQLEAKYDRDEIQYRILGGDGAGWIKDDYADKDGYLVQTDRFHIFQEIRRCIKPKAVQKEIKNLLNQKRLNEMLEYIDTYANSVASEDDPDKNEEKARKLYTYLKNNYDDLIPYRERGIAIPQPVPGIVYRNLGVQENQNCSLITLRMKNRRMRWSVNGANNLAKLKYRKSNGELTETIRRYSTPLLQALSFGEILNDVLSAAQAAKKDGKGNPYIDILNCHMPLFDTAMTASKKALRRVFE